MVYQLTDSHPSKYYAGSARPGIKLATVDYECDTLTITLPNNLICYSLN